MSKNPRICEVLYDVICKGEKPAKELAATRGMGLFKGNREKNLNRILQEAKAREANSERDYRARMAQCEAEYRRGAMDFNTNTAPYLIPTSRQAYMNWLRGYIEQGGKPTHVYDYPFPGDIYIAVGDCEIKPLYGASSISVIFPAGVKCLNYPDKTKPFDGVGHNKLYFTDGFTSTGFVPIYSDIKF